MINKISKYTEFSTLSETRAKELMRAGATILVVRTDTPEQWVTFRCEYFRDAFRGIEYSKMQFEYPLVDVDHLPPKGSTTLDGWWGFFHQPIRTSPYVCTRQLLTKYVVIYPETHIIGTTAPISKLIVN